MTDRKKELLRRQRRLEALLRENDPESLPTLRSGLTAARAAAAVEPRDAFGEALGLATRAFAESLWSKFDRTPVVAMAPRELEAADMPRVLGRSLLSVKP